MTALVLSWYAPAVWKGGKDFINQTLMAHTIDRYVGGWSKVRPFYYYLYNFPADFLPWTLFLPGALVYGFSREAFEKRKELLFLRDWFVVIFLFFSLSKGKETSTCCRSTLPLLSSIGGLWDDFISGRTGRFRHEVDLFSTLWIDGVDVFIAGAAIPWGVSDEASFLPGLFASHGLSHGRGQPGPCSSYVVPKITGPFSF